MMHHMNYMYTTLHAGPDVLLAKAPCTAAYCTYVLHPQVTSWVTDIEFTVWCRLAKQPKVSVELSGDTRERALSKPQSE